MNKDGITSRAEATESALDVAGLDWTAILFLCSAMTRSRDWVFFYFLPGTTLGPLAMDDPADP